MNRHRATNRLPPPRLSVRLLVLTLALLTACAPTIRPAATAEPPSASPRPTAQATKAAAARPLAPAMAAATDGAVAAPRLPPVATNVRVEDTQDYSFPQLLPFDGIPPVYDPRFASALEAPLLDDELVIGVALGGEAKAYPITVLRFREMVDDELAGLPILVTW